MTGIERLDTLMLEVNDNNIIKVINHLKKLTDINTDLFLNEEKTPKEMWRYISNKAKEVAVNNVAFVEDQSVYNWSLDYWKKSNDELGIKKEETYIPKVNNVVKTNTQPTPPKEQLSLF